MVLPSSPLTNSPCSFNNLRAFHSFGLWLAVNMMPPSASSNTTAISTVGVVLNPKCTTSIPRANKLCSTKASTINPLILPSRPTITFFFPADFLINQVPYADANFTISIGVRLSFGRPPMVPLKPEMLLINDIAKY